MSGLTGYLTTDGVDLSNVFMSINGGNVSLSANNTFTGNNTFSGSTTTINSMVTLPTTYSTIPTTLQLGGISTVAFQSSQSITSNSIKQLGSINILAGAYLIHLNISFSCTVNGTISRYVIEASPNNGTFTNNISQSTEYGSWVLSSPQSQRYVTHYVYSSTTSTTIYGNVLFSFSGSATCSGNLTCIRIA